MAEVHTPLSLPACMHVFLQMEQTLLAVSPMLQPLIMHAANRWRWRLRRWQRWRPGWASGPRWRAWQGPRRRLEGRTRRHEGRQQSEHRGPQARRHLHRPRQGGRPGHEEHGAPLQATHPAANGQCLAVPVYHCAGCCGIYNSTATQCLQLGQRTVPSKTWLKMCRTSCDPVLANRQVPGESVYGEKRVSVESGTTEGEKIEYRVWNPFRSKLAASVLAGVDNVHIKPGSKVGLMRVAYSEWVVACSSQLAQYYLHLLAQHAVWRADKGMIDTLLGATAGVVSRRSLRHQRVACFRHCGAGRVGLRRGVLTPQRCAMNHGCRTADVTSTAAAQRRLLTI